jgi:DNA-binding CsgD family transcriptional regulator
LCEAVARYAERGNPIERALGLYAVQRMALHGAELLERVEAESYGSYLSSHAREQERKAGLTDEEIRETAAGIISRFESARDVTVFGLYSMGKSVRQVARALRVSVGTVHYALTRIEGMGIRIIRRSGGGGSHAGNAYRQNGRLRYRSHTSEVERADRDETSE